MEVAAGIPTQTINVTSNPSLAEPKIPVSQPETDPLVYEEALDEVYTSTEVEEKVEPHEESIPATAQTENISNTLMMASVTLSNICSVCKRSIDTGDSFLQCLSCGRPGHYKHLAEMIKVTGKCPICRQRLIISMFDL